MHLRTLFDFIHTAMLALLLILCCASAGWAEDCVAEIAVERSAALPVPEPVADPLLSPDPAAPVSEVLASGSAAEAQEKAAPGAPLRLSLEASEAMAMRNSNAMRAALTEREAARGRILSAYGEALPTVQAIYDKLVSDTYAEKALHQRRDRWANLYDAKFQLQQPLFKGGKIGAALRGARLYRQSVEESIRETRHEILYNVRVLYYGILLRQHMAAVAREQVAVAAQDLAETRNKAEVGALTEYDVLRAEVEVTNEETALLTAENELEKTRSSFLRLLGLPLESAVELEGELDFRTRDALGEEALFQRALRARPEIRSAELGIEIQEQTIRATRSALFPQVSLSGEYKASTDAMTRQPSQWDKDWTVGLQVSLNLFDGFLVRGKLRELRAQKEGLEHREADLRDSVRLEIRYALLDIAASRKAVLKQEKNVEQATVSLSHTLERFKNNVATNLDVLNARTNLAVAKRNYYEAIYNYKVAWADLALSVGTLEEANGSTASVAATAAPADGAEAASPPATAP